MEGTRLLEIIVSACRSRFHQCASLDSFLPCSGQGQGHGGSWCMLCCWVVGVVKYSVFFSLQLIINDQKFPY